MINKTRIEKIINIEDAELIYFYKEEENESLAKINDFDGKPDQKQRQSGICSIDRSKTGLHIVCMNRVTE